MTYTFLTQKLQNYFLNKPANADFVGFDGLNFTFFTKLEVAFKDKVLESDFIKIARLTKDITTHGGK